MWIISNKKIFIALGIIIMVGAAVLIAVLGLKQGIDFAGGALTEVAYGERPEKVVVAERLDALELGGYSLRDTIDETGRDGYILRSRDLQEDERVAVENALMSDFSEADLVRFTSVGPVIGSELKEKAKWAIGGVIVVIILYVSFAFMGVGKPVSSWVYGGITIFALIHDVLVPTALMALLGLFWAVEVDVLFVMALLAVLGYSVNDTIVVFDRVRENLLKYRQEKKLKKKNEFGQTQVEVEYVFTKPFEVIVGESVNQTILRSINTSVTTLIALGALYVLGGDVTATFALILVTGVFAGTYSSIFLASPLLVWYAERNNKKS